jgi:uncharacterized protein YcbK (DUF882 family)
MKIDHPDRRRFLISGLGAAAGLVMPSVPAQAGVSRRIAFKNLHTRESLAATYWSDGHYRPEACRQIDRLLRDHRSGEIAPMSRRLLDALFELQARVGSDSPFEVISGYRSPRTNARLAAARSGVARRSLHMRGMAIDIRLPGCSLRRLRAHAVMLKAGGVGYYPKSGFIHVDVGRVRYW